MYSCGTARQSIQCLCSFNLLQKNGYKIILMQQFYSNNEQWRHRMFILLPGPVRLWRFPGFYSKCPATVISMTFVCGVCNHLKAKSLNIKYEISTTHFDSSSLISSQDLAAEYICAERQRKRTSELYKRFENRSQIVSLVKVWMLAVVATFMLRLFWLRREWVAVDWWQGFQNKINRMALLDFLLVGFLANPLFCYALVIIYKIVNAHSAVESGWNYSCCSSWVDIKDTFMASLPVFFSQDASILALFVSDACVVFSNCNLFHLASQVFLGS